MGSINYKVREKHFWYNQMLSIPKTTEDKTFSISFAGSNHRDWRKGRIDFAMSAHEPGTIHAQQKIHEDTVYGFVMRIPHFMSQAFCRFDSDGHTHSNKSPDIPLEERNIKTPHFHIWNENGVEIAYKTDEINLNEHTIYRDINIGLSLFCKEFKVGIEGGGTPNVIVQLSLFPDESAPDVHAGKDFD